MNALALLDPRLLEEVGDLVVHEGFRIALQLWQAGYYADTKDNTVSNTFVQLLRTR